MRATFSQTILFRGFGSSCSHPLLTNRPSYTQGSGRIVISIEPLPAALVSGWLKNAVVAATVFAVAVVFGITPSWTAFRQLSSKFFEAAAAGAVATDAFAAGVAGLAAVFGASLAAVLAARVVSLASVFVAGSSAFASGFASVFTAAAGVMVALC